MHYKMIIILICCLLSLTVQAQRTPSTDTAIVLKNIMPPVTRQDYIDDMKYYEDLLEQETEDIKNMGDVNDLLRIWSSYSSYHKNFHERVLDSKSERNSYTGEVEIWRKFIDVYRIEYTLVVHADSVMQLLDLRRATVKTEDDIIAWYSSYDTLTHRIYTYRRNNESEDSMRRRVIHLENTFREDIKKLDTNPMRTKLNNLMSSIEQRLDSVITLAAAGALKEEVELMKEVLLAEIENDTTLLKYDKQYFKYRFMEIEVLAYSKPVYVGRRYPILTDTFVLLSFPIVIDELLVDVATKDTQIIASFEDTAFIRLQKRRLIPKNGRKYVDYWAYSERDSTVKKRKVNENMEVYYTTLVYQKYTIEQELSIGILFDVKKVLKSQKRCMKKHTGVLPKQFIWWNYRIQLDSTNKIIIDRFNNSIGEQRYMMDGIMEKGEDETGYLMTALTKKSKRSRKKKIIYRHNFKAAFEVLKAEAKEQLDAFEE